MKLLNIVPYPFLPYSSGGQKLIALFNEYLGKETELYVAGTRENIIKETYSYQFIPFLNKGITRYLNPFALINLITFIRANKIETILIEHPYLGWYIPFIRLFTSSKIICHTHNVESERFRSIGKPWWRFLRVYERWVLKICDLVFCITDEDKTFFTQSMKIPSNKCITVPYGIIEKSIPDDKIKCKQEVCANHKINPEAKLLFFNGVLDYIPNIEAVDIILSKIIPELDKLSFSYHIIIAGKNLQSDVQEKIETLNNRILYAGFVEDIFLYTKAADILINPILSGGGVKTKLIEAIASNTTVVSTATGASGIKSDIAGEKLQIVADGDWTGFARSVKMLESDDQKNTPESFYNEYYWGNIIKRILPVL
jgi:glycosyltransferase involved in cell wall biosynthesis